MRAPGAPRRPQLWGAKSNLRYFKFRAWKEQSKSHIVQNAQPQDIPPKVGGRRYRLGAQINKSPAFKISFPQSCGQALSPGGAH